jgi:hypothetical protein
VKIFNWKKQENHLQRSFHMTILSRPFGEAMATIAITLPKNLREKLGDEGAQEFVSILNQINTAQIEEMERLNGRTFEKFQQELAHTRDLLSSKSSEVMNGIAAISSSLMNGLNKAKNGFVVKYGCCMANSKR